MEKGNHSIKRNKSITPSCPLTAARYLLCTEVLHTEDVSTPGQTAEGAVVFKPTPYNASTQSPSEITQTSLTKTSTSTNFTTALSPFIPVLTPEKLSPASITRTDSRSVSPPSSFQFSSKSFSTSQSPTATAAVDRRAALARSVLEFKAILEDSPLVKSALAGVETHRMHPVHEESHATGLQWTLASMLALHVRAGLSTTSGNKTFKPTVSSLLASLWILQSMDDIECSGISALLPKYLQHLPAFDHRMGASFLKHWTDNFRKLRKSIVTAQSELLQALDWHTRPSFANELVQCYSMLFAGEHCVFKNTGHDAKILASAVQFQAYHAVVNAKSGGLSSSGRCKWVLRSADVCDEVKGIAYGGGSAVLTFGDAITTDETQAGNKRRKA